MRVQVSDLRHVLEWTGDVIRTYGGDPDQVHVLVSSARHLRSALANSLSAGIRFWRAHFPRTSSSTLPGTVAHDPSQLTCVQDAVVRSRDDHLSTSVLSPSFSILSLTSVTALPKVPKATSLRASAAVRSGERRLACPRSQGSSSCPASSILSSSCASKRSWGSKTVRLSELSFAGCGADSNLAVSALRRSCGPSTGATLLSWFAPVSLLLATFLTPPQSLPPLVRRQRDPRPEPPSSQGPHHRGR